MNSQRGQARLRKVARTAVRLVGLGWVLGTASLEFVRPAGDRRQSLHRLCRRLVRLLAIRVTVGGPIPAAGLIVCNHLSYVDIIVLAATTPVSFVAKQEVRSWPIFGWFARRSGTIFVSRRQRMGSVRAAAQMRRALGTAGCVGLFPEGTSSGGDTVLPFKSSLLEPALGGLVTAAALRYCFLPGEGDPAEEICYWRDMTLVPHLLGLLGKRSILAALAFDPPVAAQTDRKSLALSLSARVRALHSSLRSVQNFEHDEQSAGKQGGAQENAHRQGQHPSQQ